MSAQAVIDATIPMRTPTLNVWQRMHFRQRKKLGQEMAWAIIGAGVVKPAAPLPRCRILVERTSPQEPDVDGLYGGLKPLLDALQPRSDRHPYGLGLIADDSRKCIVQLDVQHVAGRMKRTRIRIEPA